MIIENRWFNLQFPRRADLSGQPIGFLLVWLGGAGAAPDRKRFARHAYAREFGLHLPIPLSVYDLLTRLFPKKYVALELSQLKEGDDYIPHNWQLWPDGYRESTEAAINREVMRAPPGAKIVYDKSRCDRRIDLSGRPLQLYRAIVIKSAHDTRQAA